VRARARARAHASVPTLATFGAQPVKSRTLGFAVAILVLILDQLAKWFVTHPLGLNQIGDQLVLLPIFNFTYTQNEGISLGMLNATNPVGRWMLVLVTSAIAVGVAVWIGREKSRVDQAALGMVLGGALGNILDRVRFGYVVDFADLHFGTFRPFLVFNVGDAAISIAVVILLLRAFLTRKDHEQGPEPKETIEHA
jgi:signal peptidase II